MPSMLFPVNNVGAVGIIQDRLPHEIPFNAWSDGQNVRFRDGYVEKFSGESQVFGTPTVPPYFAMPVPTASTYLWLYLGLAKAIATDGVTHTDVTRLLGDYTAVALKNWTGGILGGIPVLNDAADDPQQWLPPGTGTKLIALSNWPANTKCNALRVYKNYLVALDVTKSGTRFGQMVKWSHGADAGAVPVTWDPTDATKDAGEYILAETGDFCVDCEPLRATNIIYKENSVHQMQYIGGVQIFSFRTLFKELGIISRRCVVEYFSGQHAVFAQNDLITHDGQTVRSVVDTKLRKWLFSRIDSTNIQLCFVVCNYLRNEVWFCFPETGQSFCNKAVVWNFQTDTCGVRDLNSIAHIATGLIDPGAAASTWAGDTDPWSSDSTTWDERAYNPGTKKLLQCAPAATKLLQADNTNQFSGSNMTCFVERTGLGIPLKESAPPDMSTMKFFDAIWPRIDGIAGTQVDVFVGVQNKVDEDPIYAASQPYIIGQTRKIDVLQSGVLLALKFQSTTSVDWRLNGYEVELRPLGKY